VPLGETRVVLENEGVRVEAERGRARLEWHAVRALHRFDDLAVLMPGALREPKDLERLLLVPLPPGEPGESAFRALAQACGHQPERSLG
jgi:hypothetical protein